ncbi:Tm-1-like ATP-binding domain-containing protein [Lichenicola sp.]|uniref:Tm-1-like ATP-binding domain-containing protein n=1 Tax=Lichenicola sp. TaxID=2804529 RepID=UPI003AFFFD20
MKRIYIAGTADTKGPEMLFLKSVVAAAGAWPVLVDVGTRACPIDVDITAETVARAHPAGAGAVLGRDDRGDAVSAMTEAFRNFVRSGTDLDGIIGLGGSGGTAIVTAGMRELRIGIPKIMVSTLASGDVSPYVGVSDIMMVPSITDLAGLNDISRVILAQAGAAVVAMACTPRQAGSGKPAIGLTMFGVTTQAVTQIVERLERDTECLVFHATGTGGRTMEKLAGSGMLSGLVDITTTEICDLLFGGVLPAGEDRLDVVATTRLPYVGSVGALDMINFWAPETMPAAYRDRLSYHHNANVTLVRTTIDECRALGRWIGTKLNRCKGQVRFLIPEKGVSALDIAGGPFFDPDADAALFEAIEEAVDWSDDRRLVRVPCHINDPEFADAVAAHWHQIAKG